MDEGKIKTLSHSVKFRILQDLRILQGFHIRKISHSAIIQRFAHSSQLVKGKSAPKKTEHFFINHLFRISTLNILASSRRSPFGARITTIFISLCSSFLERGFSLLDFGASLPSTTFYAWREVFVTGYISVGAFGYSGESAVALVSARALRLYLGNPYYRGTHIVLCRTVFSRRLDYRVGKRTQAFRRRAREKLE